MFRAAVALALAGLFYLLALAIAVGLGWAGLAMLLGGKGVNVWLLLVTFGGSIAILWGIFPRFDRFQPPGPRLPIARQLGRQDRDEDDVVDAEDDLQRGERE